MDHPIEDNQTLGTLSMCELARCHHKVMLLMVTALHHNSHETECFELGEGLLFARNYRKSNAIW